MRLKAYTMLEVVVVMGILVGIALISLPLTYITITQTNAESYLRDTTSRIYTQQQRAFTGTGASDYGVAFDANGITYFSGSSLATATDTLLLDYPNGLSLDSVALSGGASEIVYAQYSFRPSETGYVDFTDGSFTLRLQFNSEGLVEFLKFDS